MDIVPAINVACMGGVGYLIGVIAKTDPRMTALTFLVAEIAIQLFRMIDGFEKYKLENAFRVIIGGAASIYLSERHFITKTVHSIAAFMAFCLIPDIIRRLYMYVNLNIKMGFKQAEKL